MSPISVALGPPSVQFDSVFQFPVRREFVLEGSAITVNDVSARQWPGNMVGTVSHAPKGATSGTYTARVVGGRYCCRIDQTIGNKGFGFRGVGFTPDMDPSEFAAGVGTIPMSVVGIYDFHVALGGTAFPGTSTDDQAGVWFAPSPGASAPSTAPGGSAPSGGFGLFIVDDGGGNIAWNFVAYDATPTVTLRVDVTGLVPDLTAWSTFRFTLIGARDGADATLSLGINGENVAAVQGLPFDDVTLFRPRTLDAGLGSIGYNPIVGAGQDMVDINLATYFRFGRFTAAGEEVAPI